MNYRQRFRRDLETRLRKRGSEVFGYLLNLAWIMLFRDIFSLLTGKDPPLYVRILVAITCTVIAVLVAMWHPPESDDALLEAATEEEDEE